MSSEQIVVEEALIEAAVSPQKQAILDASRKPYLHSKAMRVYQYVISLSIVGWPRRQFIAVRDKQDLFMCVLTREMLSMHRRIVLGQW